MPFAKCKVYSDGSHYIAIPPKPQKPRPKKGAKVKKETPDLEEMDDDEAEDCPFDKPAQPVQMSLFEGEKQIDKQDETGFTMNVPKQFGIPITARNRQAKVKTTRISSTRCILPFPNGCSIHTASYSVSRRNGMSTRQKKLLSRAIKIFIMRYRTISVKSCKAAIRPAPAVSITIPASGMRYRSEHIRRVHGEQSGSWMRIGAGI